MNSKWLQMCQKRTIWDTNSDSLIIMKIDEAELEANIASFSPPTALSISIQTTKSVFINEKI